MRWRGAKLAGEPSESLPPPARAITSPTIDNRTRMGGRKHTRRFGTEPRVIGPSPFFSRRPRSTQREFLALKAPCGRFSAPVLVGEQFFTRVEIGRVRRVGRSVHVQFRFRMWKVDAEGGVVETYRREQNAIFLAPEEDGGPGKSRSDA